MRRLAARIREGAASVPLSRRMTRLLVAVLTVALALAGTLLIGVLKRYLVGQIDQRLRVSAEQLSTHVSGDHLPNHSDPVPSEYYLQVTSANGNVAEFITPATDGDPRRRNAQTVHGPILRPRRGMAGS